VYNIATEVHPDLRQHILTGLQWGIKMASETTTPNIGLQIAAFNQPNWQVPTNYNWNLLDLIFGGLITVPALSVESFTIADIGTVLANSFVNEAPAGSFPGNVYTLSYVPTLLLAFCWNGDVQRRGIDYTILGAVVTLNFATSLGDNVYALYFR